MSNCFAGDFVTGRGALPAAAPVGCGGRSVMTEAVDDSSSAVIRVAHKYTYGYVFLLAINRGRFWSPGRARMGAAPRPAPRCRACGLWRGDLWAMTAVDLSLIHI